MFRSQKLDLEGPATFHVDQKKVLAFPAFEKCQKRSGNWSRKNPVNKYHPALKKNEERLKVPSNSKSCQRPAAKECWSFPVTWQSTTSGILSWWGVPSRWPAILKGIRHTWGVPKMGVPQNGWFTMEKLLCKVDECGGTPYFKSSIFRFGFSTK